MSTATDISLGAGSIQLILGVASSRVKHKDRVLG